MKRSSLTSRFLALPAASRWQYVRSFVGAAAAFAILVSGIRWYRFNYLPVAYLTASVPDAMKHGDVEDSLRRSRVLLAALEKVNYDPFKVPESLKHLPDESMSESRKMFGLKKDEVSFAFPCLRPDQEETREVVFYNDVYARNNPKAYKGDVVKTDTKGFIIVGWRNGTVTTVPIQDVRVAVIAKKHCFVQVYPGMKAYDPNGLHIPAIEFPNGENSPKFQAFVKKTLATDDTEACRAPAKPK